MKRGHTVLRSTGDDIRRKYGVGIYTLRRLTKCLREVNSILGRNTWPDETTLRAAIALRSPVRHLSFGQLRERYLRRERGCSGDWLVGRKRKPSRRHCLECSGKLGKNYKANSGKKILTREKRIIYTNSHRAKDRVHNCKL